MIIGPVDHPPIAYAQDGVWVRCAGQCPQQLYLTLRSYNCPLAWSPDGEWVYYANGKEVLALQHQGSDKVRVWSGPEVITWLLKSCGQSGRLLFRAGARLVLCEPEGLERTLYQGDFFTLDASLLARKAVVWQKGELILVDWGQGTTDVLISDAPTDFTISPDGEKIAFGENWLRIFSKGQFKTLSTASEASKPSFSPDNQCVAFLNGDYELWTVNVDGSELTKLAWVADTTVSVAERRSSYAFKPAWSSDGRFLVAQLTHATASPERSDAQIEHASVIVDLQEGRAEIWPGYHSLSIFRPTVEARWAGTR